MGDTRLFNLLKGGADDAFTAACCGSREALESTELVVKGKITRVDLGLHSSEGGPDLVESDIVVKGGRVVEGDSLELFERGGEAVKLGETATTLSLDLGLDGTEPSSLELDTLGYDLFSEPELLLVSRTSTRLFILFFSTLTSVQYFASVVPTRLPAPSSSPQP